MKLYIDFETYCDLDLRETNVYRYAEHPSFEINLASWAIDDGPIHTEEDPVDVFSIPGLFDEDVLKVAWNANFERVCASRLLGLPVGEYIEPEQWHDPMGVAAELGWPMKLDTVGRALQLGEVKSAGTALINLFSKPYRGRRVYPRERMDKWAEYRAYNRQDVATMREADKRMGDWPTGRERLIYMEDQRINDRGMRIDTDLARMGQAAALVNKTRDEQEFIELTGVANPASNQQVMAWIREQELDLPDLQAETVEAALLHHDLTDRQRRVLELRQELALVAAKKFAAALSSVNKDGRLRGSFRFYGAHTGRWSGRKVQPQNLPRASFYRTDPETGKKVFSDAEQEAAILDLELGLGGTPATLKALVRPMFLLDGCVVDYSSIEARVISWVFGERWAEEAFRAGRDIYVETAERMGGLTRAQGKVAVLALGFGGGPRSIRVMASPDDEFAPPGSPPVRLLDMSDAELAEYFVKPWRKANPSIVQGWYNLQDAFISGDARVGRLLVEAHGPDRAIRLPSGRKLWYHGVKVKHSPGTGRTLVTFQDWNKNGVPQKTYGGRLAENITQAIARDVMAEALVRLEREGFRPVGHVHDEILVEGTDDVEAVARVMTHPPRWADGMPIAAEGFVCGRYRKG